MLRIGIVGYGHWGPNYARLLSGRLSGAELVACVDRRAARLAAARAEHPSIRIYADHRLLIADRALDAAIIATPVSTHWQLARDFLEAGVHILVEKPMASSTAEAEAMMRLAEEKGRVLMVGHTFLFNPAVRAVKTYIDEGRLGDVLYLYFTRTGLGPIRQDVNALWDLAPHDLSMLRYWLGQDPLEVTVRGQAYLRQDKEDVVFLTLRYPGNVIASIHVSWLDPVKVRRATVVGDSRMVVFDDTHPTEKLRLYDKGASYQPERPDYADFVASVRDGDILIPRVDSSEPLRDLLAHFVECVDTGRDPLSDGLEGLASIRVLEAAQAQLDVTRAASSPRAAAPLSASDRIRAGRPA